MCCTSLSRKLRERGVCRNRVRSARRRARRIRPWSRSSPKQEGHRQARKEAIAHLYAELIQIASTTLDQANQASVQLSRQKKSRTSQGLAVQFNELRPLVEQVIHQATRRVLQGQPVPAQEKVASLWEPHPQIIRRGKPEPYETEFGHKVNYAEVEHGLMVGSEPTTFSDWQVIAKGNPVDAEMLPPFLRQHLARFGHAPQVLTGDRGLFSQAMRAWLGTWASKRLPSRKLGNALPSESLTRSKIGSKKICTFAMAKWLVL